MPANIVAGMFHFNQEEFFELQDEAGTRSPPSRVLVLVLSDTWAKVNRRGGGRFLLSGVVPLLGFDDRIPKFFQSAMWQAIAANRRRSRLIIFVMGVVLIALGASLGTLIGPALVDLGYASPGEETWAGALAGGLAALVVWLIAFASRGLRGRPAGASLGARLADRKALLSKLAGRSRDGC